MSLVLKMLSLYFHYTKHHKGPANALIPFLPKMYIGSSLQAILFEYNIIYSTKQNSLSASKEKQL